MGINPMGINPTSENITEKRPATAQVSWIFFTYLHCVPLLSPPSTGLIFWVNIWDKSKRAMVHCWPCHGGSRGDHQEELLSVTSQTCKNITVEICRTLWKNHNQKHPNTHIIRGLHPTLMPSHMRWCWHCRRRHPAAFLQKCISCNGCTQLGGAGTT